MRVLLITVALLTLAACGSKKASEETRSSDVLASASMDSAYAQQVGDFHFAAHNVQSVDYSAIVNTTTRIPIIAFNKYGQAPGAATCFSYSPEVSNCVCAFVTALNSVKCEFDFIGTSKKLYSSFIYITLDSGLTLTARAQVNVTAPFANWISNTSIGATSTIGGDPSGPELIACGSNYAVSVQTDAAPGAKAQAQVVNEDGYIVSFSTVTSVAIDGSFTVNFSTPCSAALAARIASFPADLIADPAIKSPELKAKFIVDGRVVRTIPYVFNNR